MKTFLFIGGAWGVIAALDLMPALFSGSWWGATFGVAAMSLAVTWRTKDYGYNRE